MILASSFAINVLTFLGVFLVVVAVDSLCFDLRRVAKDRDQSQTRKRQVERNRRRINEAISVGELSQFISVPREAKERLSIRARLERLIEQSDGATNVGRLRSMTLLSATVGTIAAYALSQNALISLGALMLFSAVPLVLLIRARNQRREKLLSQLPETFGLMSRVMRSGQSITQAMQAVAEELKPPVSHEFLYCSERIKLGMEASAALREMANRTGLTEIRIFVMAVVIHRSCGGNLATLIDLLENLVRERFRIRGLVNTVTAQGRTQSMILVGMPVLIFVGLWLSNPEQSMKLLEHSWMIWTAAGLTFLGYFWVRRICRIEL